MISATAIAAAATANIFLAQFTGGGPSMSTRFFPVPYGQLACMQRARNSMYQIGATQISNHGEYGLFGIYQATSAIAICMTNQVFLVTAGPESRMVIENIKAAF